MGIQLHFLSTGKYSLIAPKWFIILFWLLTFQLQMK